VYPQALLPLFDTGCKCRRYTTRRLCNKQTRQTQEAPETMIKPQIMHKSYYKNSTEDKSLLSCWNEQTHDSMKLAGTGTGFGEFIYLKRASRLFPPLEMEASLPV